MKNIKYILVAAVFLTTAVAASGADLGQDSSARRVIAERELDRMEYGIVGETVVAVQTAPGIERFETNRWTRLATGMHYRDEFGALRESKEEIVVDRDAAHATQGPVKAIWEANANQPSALRLETPDQVGINATVLGIGYYDRATGLSVRLAEIRDTIGSKISSNQVEYAGAFDGVNADLRYTYRRGSFEQDVILRENPPSPADFGLAPETTLVEIWTEFFDTPEPEIERHLVVKEEDAARRATMREPDIYDETLAFGGWQMVPGKVFWLADDRNENAPETPLIAVAKRWVKSGGRSILIESVPFPMIDKELAKLPKQTASVGAGGREPLSTRLFPVLLAKRTEPDREMMLASSEAASNDEPGLVLDWVLVQSQSNYTFNNGQTYYVEGGVSLSGNTTFYGGAVIKFAKDTYARISLTGNVTCYAGNGPTVLTAVHDNTVGQTISSTAQSGRYGAPPYLDMYYVSPGATLSNMEFRFAKRAITDYSPYATHILQNSKMIACDSGIAAYYTSWYVNYVNFCQVPTPFFNYGSSYFWPTSLTYDCTVDSDGDTLPDEMELTFFGSFNHTAYGDYDGDGMPNGWEWQHFGDFVQSGSSDYDGDGHLNISEYSGGGDPNTIVFDPVFADDHVAGYSVGVTIDLIKGVPAFYAVLVDNPNLGAAVWQPYQPYPTVSLFGGDGAKKVMIGLKGRASTSTATWVGTTITRDSVQPAIFITSPSGSTVSRPTIQLQGYSTEQLLTIEYDLSNANGTETGILAYVTEQHFDPDLFKVTTCSFECSDIDLAPGANTITLRATDLAGNTKTTVLNYTFSLAGDTTPPAMAVHWPQTGTEISGSAFTFRGEIDDPTATVTASIVGTGGSPTVVTGLVERNGLVWVEGLPLEPGVNALTLTMTDAAGNITAPVFSLTRSAVTLTITPLSSTADLYQPVTVTGTISASNHKVWVNGTVAVQSGSTWSAANVRLNEGGTATVQARAIPNTDNGGNGTGGGGTPTNSDPGNPASTAAKDAETAADKPAVVFKKSYTKYLNDQLYMPHNGYIINTAHKYIQ